MCSGTVKGAFVFGKQRHAMSARPCWLVRGQAVLALLTLFAIGPGCSRETANPANSRENLPEQSTAESKAARDPQTWNALLPDQPSRQEESLPRGKPVLQLPQPLTGDWLKQKAHEIAEDLARQFPEDVYAQHVYAQVHRLSGDTDTAQKIWERCLEIKGDFLPAFEEVVQICMRRGDYPEAERIARQGLRFHPQAVSLRNVLATVCLEQGRLDEVISVVLAGRAIGAESAEGLFILGQAYQRKQDHQRASQALNDALKLRPDFTQAHYALSVSLARLGQREEAAKHREIFQKLKARDQEANAAVLRVESDEYVKKTVATVLYQAGVIFSNHERSRQAEECWLMASTIFPDDLASRQALVILYQQTRRPEAAVEVLSELLAREPNNVAHQVALGVCQLQLGDYDRAEQAFQAALRLDENNAAACAGLAQAILQGGRAPEEAIRWAKQAVTLAPTSQNWLVLAIALAASGDQQGAMEATAKALDMNPSLSQAQRLAQLLQESR